MAGAVIPDIFCVVPQRRRGAQGDDSGAEQPQALVVDPRERRLLARTVPPRGWSKKSIVHVPPCLTPEKIVLLGAEVNGHRTLALTMQKLPYTLRHTTILQVKGRGSADFWATCQKTTCWYRSMLLVLFHVSTLHNAAEQLVLFNI